MTTTAQRPDHSDAYIAARRAAEIEAQYRIAAQQRAAEAEAAEADAKGTSPVETMRQFLWAIDRYVRANPKPVLIATACALAFNFVLYPISHYGSGCDHLPTGTAVVLCHLEHSDTFVGSWLR